MGESFKKKEKEICFPCDICSPSLVFSGPSRYHFRKLLTFTLNACFRCEKYSTSFLRRVGRKKQLGMIHGADGKELTKTQSPQEHRNISRVQLGQKPPPPSFQPPCQLHCGGGGDQTPGTEALGNFLCLLQSWLQNTGGGCSSSSFRDIMSWTELYKSSSHCDNFPQNTYF